MCCSSMAGEGGRGCRSHQTVAVIFVLCSLVRSSTCFNWQELSYEAEQDKVVNEATVVEVRTGSILFNGKRLQSKSGSASTTAKENDKLLYAHLDQPDNTEVLEQLSLLEDNMSNEAAWQRLNPSLHCSQKTMKFTAIGSVADDLQLDMGNAGPLPLQQVPDSCGYSVQQNAVGLILEVSYDGCCVIQEDGNYTLPMTWQETPVELTCAVSMISVVPPPTTITSKSPEKLPFPFRPQPMTRRKRQSSQSLPMNDPRSPYYSYWYYYYYWNTLTASTTPTTTTTKPPETTAKQSTAKPSPVNRPMYPYYPYYPYYYYPYYSYYFQQLQTNPTKPTTTTAKPTTTRPSTTSTTTTKPTTTKTPSKPEQPVYPQYPENSEIYYYPVIQHFYGKPQVIPTKPSSLTTPTSKPSTPTTKPGKTDPTTKSSTSATKPTTASTAPTTASTVPTTASTAPTTQTVQTTPSSNIYPGPMSPFVPYYQNPFQPYVQYKSKKAGKLPFDPKFMPRAALKSGVEPRAHLHPGFNYWQPGSWFPESAGQDNPPFDWRDFLPEEN